MDRRHPWETARSRFFLGLLHESGVDRPPVNWLDVGAGDGWIAQQALSVLPAQSEITCWDINYSDEELSSALSQREGLRLVSAQPQEKFNGILMLDVIEHIEDDLSFVQNTVQTMMTDDAWILVSVPAYQFVFTSHDVELKHYRRYSPSQCVTVLKAAGLSVESKGTLFQLLLAVRALKSVKEKLWRSGSESLGVGAWTGGRLTTRAIEVALESEVRLSRAITRRSTIMLPGLSFWALCRRSGEATSR